MKYVRHGKTTIKTNIDCKEDENNKTNDEQTFAGKYLWHKV